jgi:hypothetical protein
MRKTASIKSSRSFQEAVRNTPISTKKSAHTCGPSYMEDDIKKKITKSREDWGHDLSDRAPSEQAQSPNFKPW